MTLVTAFPIAALTLLAITGPADVQTARAAAPSGTWRIDPVGSLVQFTVTKFGFADVTGRFTDFTGSVRYDAGNPQNSSVEWSVRVASVQTGEAGRDASLQAPEYFDARRHPELLYKSVRVRAPGDGTLEVDGEITLKGITRAQRIVVRPVEGGFETTFELDRFDFDVVGGSVMRRLVGRTVRVRLVAVAAREDSSDSNHRDSHRQGTSLGPR